MDTLTALVAITSIVTSRGKRNTAVIEPDIRAITKTAINMYTLWKNNGIIYGVTIAIKY
jgi:hypothetical protein